MNPKIDKLLLYARTLIWLKPVQIYGRLWFRLNRPRVRTFRDTALRPCGGRWRPIARRTSMTGPETFRFLNRTETLGSPDDWNAARLPKLWLYNAHYFDDLNADDAASRSAWHCDLIARWIAENPPGNGNGWEPYPTSLRLVNWCKWLLSGNAPVPGMLDSLATQGDGLTKRLEHHLLGNHLFANAKALVFAGCVIDGAEAERWRGLGLKLLAREIPEQILEDGGHFERSTMYHAILTEDMLDLVQLADLFKENLSPKHLNAWQSVSAGMLRFLRNLSHPDQRIAFFNDGAFGIAPEPPALLAHAAELGIETAEDPAPVELHAQTGYARLSKGPAVLLADVAPIGPDYLPGHAHADTLSFEFSLGNQRIFVNGGSSVYGGDPRQRLLERSTRYHNTLTIGDANSSEIWSDFRVARRARVSDITHGEDQAIWLQATQDGFRRISGPRHTRRWDLTESSLTIRDTLERPHRDAVARFRVHPDLHATTTTLTGARKIRIETQGATLSVEDGTWSPEFGAILPCQVLTLRLADATATITFTWEP